MGRKFFGNQSSEQTMSHLRRFLRKGVNYNLEIDPMGIHFEIDEAVSREARTTNRTQFSNELGTMGKKQRRKFNLRRRRSRPKLRSVKKGRTISLRGSLVY